MSSFSGGVTPPLVLTLTFWFATGLPPASRAVTTMRVLPPTSIAPSSSSAEIESTVPCRTMLTVEVSSPYVTVIVETPGLPAAGHRHATRSRVCPIGIAIFVTGRTGANGASVRTGGDAAGKTPVSSAPNSSSVTVSPALPSTTAPSPCESGRPLHRRPRWDRVRSARVETIVRALPSMPPPFSSVSRMSRSVDRPWPVG